MAAPLGYPLLARFGPLTLLACTGLLLDGCSADSAPAVIAFGAYFPDWLVFAILALVFAIAAWVVAGMVGFAQAVPYPLFTCLATGVLVAGAIDLLWLNR